MEQRDYIQREIEKMGAMLLAIIGKLRLISENNGQVQKVEMIDPDIIEATGYTLSQIAEASPAEIEQSIRSLNGYSEENLELISDILADISLISEGEESKKQRGKAILILEWIDNQGKTFSFARQAKLNKLRELM